jgi:dolichyl-phosphate beta-glucosyltransferase
VRLSVVIPAYNEADRLPPTLARILAHLVAARRWQPAEVVVVDDGSSDGTAAAARAVAPPPEVELRVLRLDRNRGKGAAVRTGMAASRGDRVLLSDADLSAPIEELDSLAAAVDDHTVAVGSRAVDRRLITVRQPWYRDGMGRCFNLVVRGLGLARERDTQCGFKLLPGPLARALARAQRLDGFAFDVELLLLARRWGYRVCEVGVRWAHAEASRVLPGRHAPGMLADLFRLWWWRRVGRLPSEPPVAPDRESAL